MICNYYTQNICRSCTLLELGAEQSFIYKTNKARVILADYIHSANEEPGVFIKSPSGSRHKIKFIVNGISNEPRFGIVDHSGNFTILEECPIHNPLLNDLLPLLKEAISKFELTIYNIQNRTGELKAVLISSNFDSSEIIVRLVLRSKNLLDRSEKVLSYLASVNSCIKVTSVNIQPVPHAILEGTEEIILSSNLFITENFNDIKLCFDPKSFMQVTPTVAQQLYQTASLWVCDYKQDSILDLYCGVGGFALHVAKFCNNVTGIESSPWAIYCARTAAKLNKFDNCDFIDNDLETYPLNTKVDTLIVNPPRRGLSENVLSFINKTNPQTIIYSSCNVVSLVENLKLCSKHYRISKFKFFDMFPLTEHLECLVQLDLK